MQFTTVALFATAASVVAASPALQRRGCGTDEWLKCAAALAPAAASCIASALQAEADPLTDIGCIASAGADIFNPPAACVSCFDSIF